jgi:hypothetical protein
MSVRLHHPPPAPAPPPPPPPRARAGGGPPPLGMDDSLDYMRSCERIFKVVNAGGRGGGVGPVDLRTRENPTHPPLNVAHMAVNPSERGGGNRLKPLLGKENGG